MSELKKDFIDSYAEERNTASITVDTFKIS